MEQSAESVNLPPPVCLDPRPVTAVEDWAAGGGPAGGEADGSVILNPEAKPRSLWPVPDPQPSCNPRFVAKVCGCRVQKLPATCNRLCCQGCQNKLRARRSRAIADKMQPDIDLGAAVIYLIVTVPEHRREAAADYKTWSKWCRSLWKFLKVDQGALYGVGRMDPAGDEAPTKWHPHLNLLFIRRGGRGWLDVEKVKEAWAEIIGAEHDLFGRPIIDVRAAYADATNQARINHWFDYQGRTWAAWRKSVPKHLTQRWYGGKAVPKKKKLPEWTCPDCDARFHVIRCKSELEADEYVHLGPDRALAVAWARGRSDLSPPGES